MAVPPRPSAGLPPPDVIRWTIRRKAAILRAVAEGVISREEACRRYRISAEEFGYWQLAFQTHGLTGLRVTRIRELRNSGSRRDR
jgi:Protein of unknown function (DUF1153)